MNKADELFAFVDVETTGLDAHYQLLLEVGIAVVDRDFRIVDIISRVLPHTMAQLDAVTIPPVVGEMHTGNGLWDEVLGVTKSAYTSEAELCLFMGDHFGDEKPPMAGSSLALDREFLRVHMPALESLFHYRIIDNSSTKELCRRLNPDLYAKLPVYETDHRVKTCLAGTVAEAKFYADNFLFQNWS